MFNNLCKFQDCQTLISISRFFVIQKVIGFQLLKSSIANHMSNQRQALTPFKTLYK